MYNIAQKDDYLLVKFIDDFDFPMIQTAIHHATSLRKYPDTDDIWLFGDKRAEIYLGEIDLMVKAFECRCPKDATRKKTAIVVDEGLTGAIIELMINGLRKRVPFAVRMFRTLEDAEHWLRESAICIAQ